MNTKVNKLIIYQQRKTNDPPDKTNELMNQ